MPNQSDGCLQRNPRAVLQIFEFLIRQQLLVVSINQMIQHLDLRSLRDLAEAREFFVAESPEAFRNVPRP